MERKIEQGMRHKENGNAPEERNIHIEILSKTKERVGRNETNKQRERERESVCV